MFMLDLCDIKTCYIKTIMFFYPFLYFAICHVGRHTFQIVIVFRLILHMDKIFCALVAQKNARLAVKPIKGKRNCLFTAYSLFSIPFGRL